MYKLSLDDLTKEVQGRYHKLKEDKNVDPNEWAYSWRSEYNRGGFKAVDMLNEEVINQDKCRLCCLCDHLSS